MKHYAISSYWLETWGDDLKREFRIEDDADLGVIQLQFVRGAIGNHVAATEAGPGLG